MLNLRPSYYFFASLMTSLVGVILLLSLDFAQWYYYDAYYHIYEYHFFYWLDGLIYFMIIVVLAGLLLYATYVSLRSLLIGLNGAPLPLRSLRFAFYAAIASLLGCFATGIIFLAVMIIDEPEDWWFDGGFYNGLIFAALTALFIRLGMRSANQTM